MLVICVRDCDRRPDCEFCVRATYLTSVVNERLSVVAGSDSYQIVVAIAKQPAL